MSLAVIVPSRGRPHNVARLAQAWVDTEAQATLVVAADSDDDEDKLVEYQALAFKYKFLLTIGLNENMGYALNHVAPVYAQTYDNIGFMGDDHLPRTPRWDEQMDNILAVPGIGIAYGNDLYQGAKVPTAVFMRSSIIKALGYMSPPELNHMFHDNAWATWGYHASCIAYLPGTIIEHMHPFAKKAEWDAGYARVNEQSMYDNDQMRFTAYLDSGQIRADVNKIKDVLT